MVAPPSTGGNAAAQHPQSTSRSSARIANSSHHPYAPNVPLSARRAAPLDLSTVERRGHQSAVREPVKRVRPHGLPEAPTFRPTEEEFKDPMEYIRKIAPEGKKYGICKIIPPDSWDPPFAIDTERFHFRTRRQELNSVEGGTRANLNYLDQLTKFHRQHGTTLARFPSVDKRPLDLYKLKKAVEVRGGFDQVCKLKKWAEIGRDLGYSGKIMSSLSTSLKNSYQRWLQPYENYLLLAKPGVQQQLEIEHGGPFTPSPKASPPNKKVSSNVNGTTGASSKSSTVKASAALNSSLERSKSSEKSEKSEKSAPPPEPASIRPITVGFTAVNAPANGIPKTTSFVPINNGPSVVKKETDQGAESTTTRAPDTGTVSKNSESRRVSAVNGHDSYPLKRALGNESAAGTPQAENGDDGANGRRSKRLKKDVVPTVSGSNMSLLRPAPPQSRPKGGNRKTGDKCETCGKSNDRPSILLCDGCDNGYHMHCLDPPLSNAPNYDWHCPKCLVGTGEYGFEEGGIYSLKQFQEKADAFKRNYFSGKMPFDPVLNAHRRETEDDVEREFWRLVESLTETVEVEYGADIHSTTHGSGFPTVERNPLDPYSVDPWNLNVLPLHGESLFRHIKSDVSGMTVPWVYVGMCFSTFCWHNEDHYSYSANYQHFGATKTWYGIPGEDAEAFEEAMRQAVPELFETQPDLLFQLVTLLPPDQLKKAGVNVYALDQRAGQFVITFPQAYHAGFNHGFNFNEAVNFAPADWEPLGQAGVARLREFRRQPCFSHDELLLTAAARDTSIKTAKWLGPALRRMCDRELEQRAKLLARQKELKQRIEPRGSDENKSEGHEDFKLVVEDADLPEEDYQCSYCKVYSYLTQFRCHKKGKILCLLHADNHTCCDEDVSRRLLGPNHSLRYRMSDEDIAACTQKVEDRARIPEAWGEKLERILEDEPKPSLKAMHSLLSEGEKIPYHLPGLQDLATFVQRCDKWVEEANNYITRKQQNRRKNEKLWRRGNAAKAAQLEERDRELRNIDKIHALLAEAENLSFDCPQIVSLREKVAEIQKFQGDAQAVLCNPHVTSTQEVEELVELGKSFNVDVPEVDKLERVLRQMRWNDEARRRREQYQTLDDCREFIKQGEELGLAETNEHLLHFRDLYRHGETWEAKAKELMSVEAVHYQQLEALSAQAARFPVSPETLAAVEAILTKQREAQKQISNFYEKSKSSDFRMRPHYKDVRELMESLSQLNSKPTGTIDLEREQKRHEDWMRRGKKLFGKANAPLHILKMHMQYVEKKNSFCFDLEDRCRPPVEPASRETTPEGGESHSWVGTRSKKKDVFCICRQQEAGLMIECEVCHEWYHGKCLKIARGKVKEYDSYTCPICDWRVKIPRDAARPKLEDLIEWQAEIPDLPFQPDEEQILEAIIDKASAFRDFIRSFTNSTCTTAEEVPTQIFYLRKIEGAEVLLAYETNYFRQEIHRWAPVAPDPPPILEQSLSTRKPRPTKQQKLMAQLGIDKPEDLPLHLRTKYHTFPPKRKSTEPHTGRPTPLQPAPLKRSDTPTGEHGSISAGNTTTPPTLPPIPASQPPSSFSGSNPFSLATSDGGPPYTTGPGAFLPQDGNSHSPAFASTPPATRHPGLDQALFSPPDFNRSNPLRSRSPPDLAKDDAGVGVDIDHSNPFGSSPRPNMDELFADLTNQDVEPVEEISHANEALEALKTAQNCSSRDRSMSESRDGLGDAHQENGLMGGLGQSGNDATNALEDEFLS
ncbi:hypothetical protein D8B26_006216 [Coccidioides posadasii str. Silveira]|uniref:PHD transcription factor n=1 Tax=Coccidioides posadasii (strain RMSCC 757 / Silveira) TaxID=443226 RepID=E9DBA3_COCPS|nr:PHD transcription factor [Coccidioides posadasii str. Silveira]QVM11569.1 hypothetical protein D8B26_006216 [Coccidioides posadasii str. Silveira]